MWGVGTQHGRLHRQRAAGRGYHMGAHREENNSDYNKEKDRHQRADYVQMDEAKQVRLCAEKGIRDLDDEGVEDYDDFAEEWGFPAWKANSTLRFQYEKWRLQLRTNFIGSQEQDVDGIDVFSDIAFLLMDLDDRGATPLYKGYTGGSDDHPPFPGTICASINNEIFILII